MGKFTIAFSALALHVCGLGLGFGLDTSGRVNIPEICIIFIIVISDVSAVHCTHSQAGILL